MRFPWSEDCNWSLESVRFVQTCHGRWSAWFACEYPTWVQKWQRRRQQCWASTKGSPQRQSLSTSLECWHRRNASLVLSMVRPTAYLCLAPIRHFYFSWLLSLFFLKENPKKLRSSRRNGKNVKFPVPPWKKTYEFTFPFLLRCGAVNNWPL